MKHLVLCTLLVQFGHSKLAEADKRKPTTPLSQRKLLVPEQGALAKPKMLATPVKRSAQFYSETWQEGRYRMSRGIVDVEGYAPGDVLHVERQSLSAPLPQERGEDGLRGALRGALRFSEAHAFLTEVRGRQQTWEATFTLPEFRDPGASRQRFGLDQTLNAPSINLEDGHTYRILVKRAGQPIGTHFREPHPNDNESYWSAHWVQRDNLFVSPVYENDEGRGEAVLLGLAAYPLGARITVTNMTMLRAGLSGHTSHGEASTSTGSARLVIPDAAPGHEYKVTIGNDAEVSVTFRLPAHDHPLIAKGGMGYFAIKEFEVEQ